MYIVFYTIRLQLWIVFKYLHMKENPHMAIRSYIYEIVTSKGWYMVNSTGVFDFNTSVAQLGEYLFLPPERVKQALTNAITPECLSQVVQDIGGKVTRTPLLQALTREGIPPHLWTEGGEEWQRTKIIKSGADTYVPENRCHIYSSDKLHGLGPILSEIGKDKKNRRVIIVDDKWSNIEKIKQLANEYGSSGIEMVDYHMKLNDPQADATAFFEWLLKQKYEVHERGQEFELILDFDGVVINTDEAIQGKGVDALVRLSSQGKQGKIEDL